MDQEYFRTSKKGMGMFRSPCSERLWVIVLSIEVEAESLARLESRCAARTRKRVALDRGTNYVRGSLNWGPTLELNAGLKTTGWWKLRRGSYDTDFHTYTLEWTEDFV